MIGGCEETTTGIHRLRAMAAEKKLEFPVVAVNDTPMKRFFDNVHGTGESVLSSIMITTNTLIAGKYFVVAGYGYCGRGLAQKAHGLGAKVVVTEVDPRRALEAHMDGYHVMTMDQAAEIGDIFVTTTGNTSVIGKDHFGKLKSGAILANAGHFNVEIDIAWLAKHADSTVERDGIITYVLKGKPVHVLAEGRLVNLATPKGMGHPIEVMDLSFALQALCTRYIAEHGDSLKGGVYEVPQEIDEQVARLKLASLGLSIDELLRSPEEVPMQLGYRDVSTVPQFFLLCRNAHYFKTQANTLKNSGFFMVKPILKIMFPLTPALPPEGAGAYVKSLCITWIGVQT